MKSILTLLTAVIVFVLALAIGSQNDAMVDVNYLLAKDAMRLSTLMAICFLFGCIVTALFGLLLGLKSGWRHRRRQAKGPVSAD